MSYRLNGSFKFRFSVYCEHLKKEYMLSRLLLMLLLSSCFAVIQKSKSDKNKYKIFRAPGGLKVSLVEDPTAKICSMAMRVNVGSLEDPENYPGVAHFVEHMLFMGSRKYPLSSAVRDAVNRGGGEINAFTDFDQTTYYADVRAEAFENVVDIFANMFIEPLFRPEDAKSEVRAVHSEHQKNLKQDVWRIFQIVRNQGNPLTPISKFTTGNLSTLNKPDIIIHLRSFFKKYYLASRMTLSLYCSDMKVLTNVVEKSFGDLKSPILPQIDYSDLQFFRPMDLGKFLRIKTVSSFPKMNVYFILPYVFTMMSFKPLDIISSVLGNEGPNSLLQVLIKNNLASSINTSFNKIGKSQIIFEMSISLTEKGYIDYKTILSYISRQIRNLKTKSVVDIFEDLKKDSLNNFEFQSPKTPTEFTKNMVLMLNTYPKDKVLFGPFEYTNFNQKLYDECIQYFRIGQSIIVLASNELLDNPRIEPIYKTKYTVSKFSFHDLFNIQNNNLEISDLKLPSKNYFIPTFEENQKSLQLGLPYLKLESTPIPENIMPPSESHRGKLFYLLDRQYSQPIIRISLSVYLNKKYLENILDANHFLLLSGIQSTYLSDLTYEAQSATISTTASYQSYGILFDITGLAPTFGIFIKKYSQKLSEFLSECPSEEMFDQEYYTLLARYDAFVKRDLYNFGKDSINWIFQQFSYSPHDLYPSLKLMTYKTYCNFHKNFLNESYLEGIITGKILKQDALNLFNELSLTLQPKVLPLDKITSKKLYIPKQSSKLVLRTPNKKASSNFFLLVKLFDESIESQVFSVMVEKIVSTDFFEDLRTNQQLGYIVFANSIEIRGIQAVEFGVQTEDFKPEEVSERVKVYMKKVISFVEKMNQQIFDKVIQLSINTIKKDINNLQDLHSIYIDEQSNRNFKFDTIEKKIEKLKQMTLPLFVKNFKKYFEENPLDLEISYTRPDDYRKNIDLAKKSSAPGTIFFNIEDFKKHAETKDDIWIIR